jgi:hypothetical protein
MPSMTMIINALTIVAVFVLYQKLAPQLGLPTI